MRSALLASALILGSGATAFAQYTGPSDTDDRNDGDVYTPTTIQTILDDPDDDDYVSIEGVLLRKLGDEMYLFSDGTAQINVEIEDEDFPNSEVSETTRLRIDGEVDTHLLRDVEIEADDVIILD